VVEGEIPLNRAQRNFLPSDHLMIRATVGVGPLVAPPEPPAASHPSWVQRVRQRLTPKKRPR